MQKDRHINVCIIRKSSIGDVILSTVILEYLQRFDNLTIFWLGSKPSLQLIEANYPEVQCFEYSNRAAALSKMDASFVWIDLQSTMKTFFFYLQFCISQKSFIKRHTAQKRRLSRYWIIIKNRFYGRNKSHKLRLSDHSVIHDLQNLIKNILPQREPQNFEGDLQTNLTNISRTMQSHTVLNELDFGTWICVAPGAKYKTKKLPASLVANFLNDNMHLFQQNLKPQLLFVGGKDEQDLIAEICNLLAGKFHYLNLCGKLSLPQTALAISKSRFTIAADSALAHLSEALHIETFMIYGPTAPELGFHLHHKNNYSIASSIGCSPCSRHGKATCRYGDQACFQQADLSPIQTALQNMVK